MGEPYSKEEFKFCYKALMNLWQSQSIAESAEARRNLRKMRNLYKEMNP